MKKHFPTYIHETCLEFPYIYVSAGQRGLQIKVDPNDLIKEIHAEVASCLLNNSKKSIYLQKLYQKKSKPLLIKYLYLMFSKHPKGLIAAALANLGERFGFYTMMAILVLFLQAKFGLDGKSAGFIYSTFYFSIYILAL